MSGRRHWSEGTPFADVKVGAPVAGMPWTLSPATPVPPGYAVAQGRLVALPGYGYATDVDGSPVEVVPAAGKSGAGSGVDALVAEASAAISRGRPRVDPAVWCGRCGPCRNGSRSQCLHRGTAHAAACRAADTAEGRRWLAKVAPTLDEQIEEIEANLSAGWHAKQAEHGRSWVWAG